tara:strand:- start:824 stop:1687 length:864 start_codon:yes stop_codon:yes gene_type:complete
MRVTCDVLVIGSTGMLGSAVLRFFHSQGKYKALGTSRQIEVSEKLASVSDFILKGVDVGKPCSLDNIVNQHRPTVVINCVGLVKQVDSAADPLKAIAINSMFPHQLHHICKKNGARLIHISTDCVFDGSSGLYTENDWPNATDLYGKTKFLGEIIAPGAVTLRTSIIGHEINKGHSLLEWFLEQRSAVKGFRNAIFSGFPTVELARVIHDYIVPNQALTGLYHVSADPIDKFALLNLIAKQYKREINITADYDFIIDRSLNSSKFALATGFEPTSWPDMIALMHHFG